MAPKRPPRVGALPTAAKSFGLLGGRVAARRAFKKPLDRKINEAVVAPPPVGGVQATDAAENGLKVSAYGGRG
jgi:hypothetical protein